MKLEYFESSCPFLVEEYYKLSLSKNDIPLESTIMPLGMVHITYNFGVEQKAIVGTREISLKGLMITGQLLNSYQFVSKCTGNSLGLSLHPTALHKILNIDVSKLENGHFLLKDVSSAFHDLLNPLFIKYHNDNDHLALFNDIDDVLNSTNLTINKQTEYVDMVIAKILQKEGMISIDGLLAEIKVSQKTLETQFKKIVGLTPGKYIRLIRFLHLMKKYESDEIGLKDLIYMYDYYDHSHFNKDFKMYMQESPRSYFKKEYPLVHEILIKH